MLSLAGGDYELRPLCAAGLLECIRLAKDCLCAISPSDGYGPLIEAVAENGALASMCLYRGGARAFPTPLDALRALTVDELCAVYDACAGIETEAGTERGQNEAFPVRKGAAE